MKEISSDGCTAYIISRGLVCSQCTLVRSHVEMDPAFCNTRSRAFFICGVKTSWHVMSHSLTRVLSCMPQHAMPSATASLQMPT